MASATPNEASAKPNDASAQRGRKEVRSVADMGGDDNVAVTRTVMRPSVRGAVTIEAFSRGLAKTDLGVLIDTLRLQAASVAEGDLRLPEATLVAQASTLDAIFHNLALRASGARYLDDMERYLKLALRAQGQCRATLETLAEIKNPMAGAYVRQANIAAGHQQVNNGDGQAASSRARERGELKIQLLEVGHDERLDAGTKGPAGGAHQDLAAVAKVDGTQDG